MTDIGIDSRALTEFIIMTPSAQADVRRYGVAIHALLHWRREAHALQHVDPANETIILLMCVISELDQGNHDTRNIVRYMLLGNGTHAHQDKRLPASADH